MITEFALTLDDSLILQVDHESMALVRTWLPLHARPVTSSRADFSPRMRVHVSHDAVLTPPVPLSPVIASIGRTSSHIMGDTACVVGPHAHSRLDLAERTAEIRMDRHDEADVHSIMNLVISMLLARERRYLMHCGGIESPRGGVWLLAGDSGAGKTTTTLNLAHAGWSILADDHVVLYRENSAWCVEGWPRPMHVDTGWATGTPSGVREAVDPRTVARDAITTRTGRLRGLLLPRVVRAARITTISHASHADALAMLLRQTAWSIADPAVAARAFGDITDAASMGAFHLDLAIDTFADPARIAELVEAGAT